MTTATKMTFDESTHVITEIALKQTELLDYTGHVIRGLPRERARKLVDEINAMRASVGWKPLDMTGRWQRRSKMAR